MNKLSLKIEDELSECWSPIVDYHIDHMIAPLGHRFRSGQLAFFRQDMPNKNSSWFRCEVKYRCRNSRSHRITIVNSDGSSALVDALSRLKRDLLRQWR